MLGPRPTPVQPAYRTGSTYTGVDESVVGCKPGIVKTVVKVDEGVYKTREVKLTLRYGGYDPDTYDGADGLVLSLTLPAKWLDGGVPIRRLRDAFIGHYRKKRPSARLAAAADEEWGLAIKDESMLLFSKKRLDDDADLTKALYDRQEVYAMTARAQILPGATFVVLAGWYKQQCVLALDIGLRTADDSIEVLDGALTLQQVYEQSIAAAATLAKRLAASSGAALPDAPDLPADSPLAAVAAAAAADTDDPAASFEPAEAFAGPRAGRVFKRGARGVGYYSDAAAGGGAAGGGGGGRGGGRGGGDGGGGGGRGGGMGGPAKARTAAVAARESAAKAARELEEAISLGIPDRLRQALVGRSEQAEAAAEAAEAEAAEAEAAEAAARQGVAKVEAAPPPAEGAEEVPPDVEAEVEGGEGAGSAAAERGQKAPGEAPSFLGRAMVLGALPAPRGWTAPAETQPSVNENENCAIM
ncbi:hypothetical protein EMIHUDRAFT_107310 [Emiliania huxleyi CCMP1516]|uniref:Uncharacterized protein n=2 Tax=Emiliania huxleyi TaxID=2903 RepID=A0A0D3I323_EMIH1|nr:hypothetical protein EMIHUDRAFT_107310 [Emiliania huxleyi CCMP1516]EOD05658.1 hypothetical protein EMIHUDRAFT_107310 [Emiliania huxleyi CCMP1516]|eukprot:XP_005758087.1 hypothetical protein EMIHUDRAFT_107310 [Emiliania huxleyi CCMP1516]